MTVGELVDYLEGFDSSMLVLTTDDKPGVYVNIAVEQIKANSGEYEFGKILNYEEDSAGDQVIVIRAR